MNTTFSNLLSTSEGRHMTALEEERVLASCLEMPRRLEIARMLQQCEYSIIDYATNAFCDIMPDFEGPEGSIRRKKGHQDGRIILRYIAQAVREGSPDVLFEKVLSWLIGHLDNRNVTGQHMEVFFHFILQGVRRDLPVEMHSYVETVFEQVITFVRISSHSGTIQRAHRRIAEFAVDRVMAIVPDAKTRYGASSMPKCRRDFELLVKEVARVMKSPSPERMTEDLTRWLIDRLMNQVEYPVDVWYWSFMALREGVIECCGVEAGRSVNDLFETLADRTQELLDAVRLASAAGDIASAAADTLLESGEPLGLLRADEFKTAVVTVNRQIVTDLAVFHACGNIEHNSERLADLWCQVVLPLMPSSHTSLLAANLTALLKAVDSLDLTDAKPTIRSAVMKLVDVARRAESAQRLASIMNTVASEAADVASESFGVSPAESRDTYRDIRVILAKLITFLPSGAASTHGYQFRQYIVRFLMPTQSSQRSVLQRSIANLIRLIEKHASPEDARLARGFLDKVVPCMERHARLIGIADHADKFTISAVERGYQSAPRHASLNRHGLKAGRRDGVFLLEKLVLAATIGGQEAERELHRYFINEQIRLSKLPGGVVVEFLRGLQEQLRDFPEVVELLASLAQVAPAYTGSIKLDRHSTELATHISEEAINASNAYRTAIGENGLQACVRDNSIMIRGLATFFVQSPMDVGPFKNWWKKRIGRHLKAKPDGYQAQNPWSVINLKSLVNVLSPQFDFSEIDMIETYLKQVVTPDTQSTNNKLGTRPSNPSVSVLGSPDNTLTFADVTI